MFICGVLKDESTIDYFKKNNVDVLRVWNIFKEVKKNENDFKTGAGNRYHQLLFLNR